MADGRPGSWGSRLLRRHLVPRWELSEADHLEMIRLVVPVEEVAPGRRGDSLWEQSVLLFANSLSSSGGGPAAIEFGIYDGHARRIGSATRVATGALNTALLPVDAHLPHCLEIRDASGELSLRLLRPVRLLASKWVVLDGSEQEVGRIVQDKVLFRSTFTLSSGGEPIADVRSERLTFRRFVAATPDGRVVARIAVPPLGHATMNTENGMNSVLHMLEPVTGALRLLLVATALAVATGP